MHKKTSIRQGYKNKFTVISNKLAQNNDLSLKARGLMCYFLSLPDDWIIYVDQLKKVMKEKRCAILSGIKELKKAGYIHHVKLGYKDGWQYFTFGEPISEEEFKLFLRTNRFSTNSETEEFDKQQLQNTHSKDKESIYIEKEIYKEKTEDKSSLASKEAHDLSSFSKDVFEISEYLLMKYNDYRKSLDLPPCITIFSKKACKEVQGLLKEFPKDRLISLINFAFEDDFWKKVIESPFSLKKNLRKLETAQANTKKITSNPNDNYEYSKSIELKFKKLKGTGRRQVTINANRTYFEIVFNECNSPSFTLEYMDKDFKNKLDEALKQYNLL